MVLQFPNFHLQDKVKLLREGNDRTLITKVYAPRSTERNAREIWLYESGLETIISTAQVADM